MVQTVLPPQPDMQATVTLYTRDGRPVRVRHMHPDDADRLVRMFYRLSPETRYRRFFMPLNDVDEKLVRHEAAHLATIDPEREAALIALVDEGDCEEAIAVARFARLAEYEDACEASIVIRDDYQGVGIGRQLFDLLVQTARERGFRHMILLTHADNRAVIALVRSLGLPYHVHCSSGLYEMDLQISGVSDPIFPFTGPAVHHEESVRHG